MSENTKKPQTPAPEEGASATSTAGADAPSPAPVADAKKPRFATCRFAVKVLKAVCKKTYFAFKLALVLGFLAAILAICVFFCTDNIIKFAINNAAQYVDLNAQTDDVDIRFFTQTVALKNVVIKNPSGFIEHDAFTASKIEIKFDIFDKENPIKRVYLQNPKLKIEGKFGKRILPQSMRRGNIFVIVREIMKIAGVDLEKQVAAGPDSPLLENVDKIEKGAEAIARLGEVRIDNLHVENGLKDSFDIGSIILHGDLFEMRNFSCNICDVLVFVGGGIFDIPTETLAITNFSVKNPEGYPNADALKLGKVQVVFGDKKDENGGDITCIKKITVDSPILRLEDKAGSMLGAVGLENNYMHIVKSLSVFHGVDVSNMFNDDFEIAIRDKEIDVPRIELDTTEILNARVTCGENDGFLISKIDIDEGLVVVKNVRVNLAKIKMRFDAITIDPKTQSFVIDKLALRNPAEFPEENAFLMDKFILSTHIKEENIRGNRVLTVESLTLKDFFVRLDSRTGEISGLLGGDNNLFGLIDDFKDASARVPAFKDSVQKQINEDTTERPRRYVIKKINFVGGEIRIGPRGDAIKIPMETFSIDELGLKTGGVTADEIAVVLIREIAMRALDSAEDQLAEGWGFLKPVIKAFHEIVRMLM